MSKRERSNEEPQAVLKNGQRFNEIGDFDDDSDEFESEDEDEIFQQSDDDDYSEDGKVPKVYLPGTQLREGEILEVDRSAYEMLHDLHVKWPALSFDVLWDTLGQERRTYPGTMYLVAGTQADSAKHNELQIIKLSNLSKSFVDDSSSISSSESITSEPSLEFRAIPVLGGTNRVRATQQTDFDHVVATMMDTGAVHIWNVESHIRCVDGGPLPSKEQNQPMSTIKSHGRVEGYALDWSNIVTGALLTGDNDGNIYHTSSENSRWTTESDPWKGHASSVEDLQWSPTERTVFASASADGTVKIWDHRSKKRGPAISVNASAADVNVISWNHNVPYLLASGSDDGSFAIWDLRHFQAATVPSPVACFTWHKAPITSIEWHPTDESCLAVGGADDQLTLWDLSVEMDKEEQAAKQHEGLGDVPSQLMFVHMGQKELKEVHWHRQISNCVISTAGSGFNVFKTAY